MNSVNQLVVSLGVLHSRMILLQLLLYHMTRHLERMRVLLVESHWRKLDRVKCSLLLGVILTSHHRLISQHHFVVQRGSIHRNSLVLRQIKLILVFLIDLSVGLIAVQIGLHLNLSLDRWQHHLLWMSVSYSSFPSLGWADAVLRIGNKARLVSPEVAESLILYHTLRLFKSWAQLLQVLLNQKLLLPVI